MAHTTFYCIMATSQVLFRILLLVVAASETQSVPVYERYETCVASQQSDYQNPFNYTEVAIFGQIILARSNRCCDLPQVITQGVFSGPDGNIIVDGYKTLNISNSVIRHLSLGSTIKNMSGQMLEDLKN